VHLEGTPCVQGLATSCAGVAEAAQEVAALYVVPDVGPSPVGEDVADGADVLVGGGVLGQELVQVLGLLDALVACQTCGDRCYSGITVFV